MFKKSLLILSINSLLFLNLSVNNACLVELDPNLLEDGLQATLCMTPIGDRELREILQRKKNSPLTDIALTDANLIHYIKQLFDFQRALHSYLAKNPNATIEEFLNTILKN